MRLRSGVTWLGGLAWFTIIGVGVWAAAGWMLYWKSIFTNTPLVSPLGCDCGISLSFWQHPGWYGIGLLASLSLWVVGGVFTRALWLAWKQTRTVYFQFSFVPVPSAVHQLWADLVRQLLPGWWPSFLTPGLQVVQEAEPRAMTVGVVHPRVVVSAATLEQLSEVELQAVLTHELMHVTALDALSMWLIKGYTRYWPESWRLYVQTRWEEYVECQTDLETVRLLGVGAVGQALLSVSTWEQQPSIGFGAQISGVVELRLEVLAGWTKQPALPWKLVTSLAASAVVSLGLIFGVLKTMDTVYAQALESPACMEVESVVVVNQTLYLYCPLPMSRAW